MTVRTADQDAAARVTGGVLGAVQTVFAALVLLVVFTPFESPDSYVSVLLPRFAVILGVLAIAPRVMLRPIRQLRPAWIMLAALLLHLTLFVPAPLLQLGAEWAGFIACLLFARLAAYRAGIFLPALRAVLVINVAALAVQAALGFASGDAPDLHSALFPVSEARTGYESFGFLRTGGFHIEPGTYATWVAMLIVLARLVGGRFGIVEWVAMGSLLVTYSTAGAIYFAVLAFWNLLDGVGAGLARSLGVLTVLGALGGLAVTSLGVDDYLFERFVAGEGVAAQEAMRGDMLELYARLPLAEKLGGFGHASELCEDCPFDDLGFVPNYLMRGGVLSLCALVLTLWGLIRLLGLNAAVLTLLVVGSAKAATNALAPWLVLLVASEVGVAAVRETRRRQRRRRRRRR